MMRIPSLLFCIALMLCILVSCSPGDQKNGLDSGLGQMQSSDYSMTASPENEVSNAPDQQQKGEEFHRELPRIRGQFFSTSGECSVCHTNLKDEFEEDVSIDQDWRATMMANASRDPYFLATVRSESQQNPVYSDVIQSKCATCHMPMSFQTAKWSDGSTGIFKNGLLGLGSPLLSLSEDGVSCTVCHQITSLGLGEPESFSGGYIIDPDKKMGDRLIFGPFEIDESLALIMQSASSFIPEQSDHMSISAFCGACHTLYTTVISTDGEITEDMFPEQTPYLEWLHSQYADSVSCRDCHMPEAAGEVLISMMANEPRSPFSQHIFAGGNRYMLQVFNENADVLGITMGSEQIEEKIIQVEKMLKEKTAVLAANVGQTKENTKISVTVQNLTGHKFPTGFPSRRAWIHVLVKDIDGNPIFESGGWLPDGSIIGNDNDINREIYEPHYKMIDDPGEVQIYEAIIHNCDQQVSTNIMQALIYVKDNRLLPEGFDKYSAMDDIAVYGLAQEDDNFTSGMDEVEYIIYQNDQPPIDEIIVELLYQSIGYRWKDKFSNDTSFESLEFNEVTLNVKNEPIVIDSFTISTQ